MLDPTANGLPALLGVPLSLQRAEATGFAVNRLTSLLLETIREEVKAPA